MGLGDFWLVNLWEAVTHWGLTIRCSSFIWSAVNPVPPHDPVHDEDDDPSIVSNPLCDWHM